MLSEGSDLKIIHERVGYLGATMVNILVVEGQVLFLDVLSTL